MRNCGLVREPSEQEPDLSLPATVKRVAPRVGTTVDRLGGRCKRADMDGCRAPGSPTSDTPRLKELEWANRALKRANAICWRSPPPR